MEILVIKESYRTSMPSAKIAFKDARNSKGIVTIFIRNKEMKIEHKLVFHNGELVETRVKLGHKICTSDSIYDDIPEWDKFIDTIGM